MVPNQPLDRISVNVKAFATLREVMDSQTTLDVENGSTISTLLTELSRRYAGLEDLLFSRPGILRDLVNILKNGRNIQYLAGLDTPLENGDLVALFPPAAGG